MTSTARLIKNHDQFAEAFGSLVQHERPTFFKLRAQLPTAGRTNEAMAATERMTVMLKTYAASGENGLHAHVNEDHTFIVLQGSATFYGPGGEEKIVRQHEGVMLPKGTLYWFQALGSEPLVMVRVGCSTAETVDMFARIDAEGRPVDGDSADNKEVPLVLGPNWFGALG